jgi:hypothetical protein
MKNLNGITVNRTRNIPDCSAQPQQAAPTSASFLHVRIKKKKITEISNLRRNADTFCQTTRRHSAEYIILVIRYIGPDQ